MKRVLLLSLANQGYQYLYRCNLRSHQDYAERYGYDYQCLTRPVFSTLGAEVVWLKLYAMRSALDKGYDWVVFIDADALIRSSTPAISSVREAGKSVYMAKGYSGRFNSGVIIVENTPDAKRFLSQVIDAMDTPLEAADDVGWGENGHVIACAKDNGAVATIDQRWNNNFQPALDDYIRHYSAGPLHHEHRAILMQSVAFWLSQSLCKVLRRIWRLSRVIKGSRNTKRQLLEQAHRDNQAYYGVLNSALALDSVQDRKDLQCALQSEKF